ncbi:MAG: 16S rRNA (adenine(1518)-N(6)/adenine(1519)-N(6))-dimethyltransferase RsmA [Patescibacteria group bacterium]|nr:16S rRNA (adenine(1518)-N(6)/adenine(1519)-N(6))-dimethyltransferase RsmA [Patescibacteria group bacterium]
MSERIIKQTLDLCKMYDIQPQKSKGQNFLISEDVYDKIISYADLKPEDTVLEVGPGLGFLTFKLAQKVKKVLAVELDSKIVEVLQILIQGSKNKNIKIFNKDILTAKGDNFSKISPYKIVSNLPYNITSIFLRKFLSLSHKPELIVLMLQKEVVSRIIARPPKMSLLSLSVQFYAEVELMLDVPRDNFYPSPEVDSAIIKIIPNKKLLDSYQEEKKFFKLLRVAFSAKRKMLKNNLEIGLKIDEEIIKKVFKELDLDLKVRAEQISLEEWLKIYGLFKNYSCLF